MIDLNKLKKRQALNLLIPYKGINPYIRKLQKEYELYGTVKLTESQAKYVIDNIDFVPLKLDRVVEITEYAGKLFQQQDNLSITPTKILIEYILSDNGKRIHFYGKLKRNQKKSGMYFLSKTQLIDDPYFEPFDLDINFQPYIEQDSFVLSDGTVGRTPYEHQEVGVKFLLSRPKCILADDMGLGKAVSTHINVLTPNGKTTMGELKIGDYVIGRNGKKTKVLEIHHQPIKEMYKITFNDGYSTECCKEHMWTVMTNNGSVNNKNRGVRYQNLTVEQMLDEDLEIVQKGTGHNKNKGYKFKTYYKQPNGQNKWQIPIIEPIKFENNYKLPIEPYLLGLSLGDGHISNLGTICIRLEDNDFDELFKDNYINEGKRIGNIRTNNINILKEEVKELKLNGTLSHTKFIPDVYKYSSIEDRISILQGLMDTDGHCVKSDNGNFVGTEYCTVSKQLANDVAEIVHSLGGIVRMKEKIGSYKKLDGTKVICKKAYRLNIKFSNDINPFRLIRKANEYNQPKKYKVGRYIKNIEPIGLGESVCIKVDAEDSLFVLDHGIVTHNTYISIIAALESKAEKVLIVCPSSLKINWKREIEYLSDDTVEIIDGKEWRTGKFTIINFDILKNFSTIDKDPNDTMKRYTNELNETNFDLIIVDEAHNLKNPKSNRGKIIQDMAVNGDVERIWLMTGTPISNRPMDYFNLLKIIESPIAEDWHFYAKRYCDLKKFTREYKNGKKRTNFVTDGASNLDELHLKTKNGLLRRKKTEVLDMPDKTIIANSLELTKQELVEYDFLWEEYLQKRLDDGKRNNHKITESKDMIEIGLLRKFVGIKAIPHTIKLAENAIEQGNKVIIFTNFTEELEILHEHFKDISVIHHGPMNDKNKQKSVDDFQKKDKTKVFIGNIVSAGVGITLTASNVVIFNSFDWVPGLNEQCEDRSYRIGQKNNVTIYYQLFKNSISERIWATLKRKKEVISQIIGDSYEENFIINTIIDLTENDG